MLIINPAESWLTDSKMLYKADNWVVGSPYSWVVTSPNNAPVRDLVLLSNLSSRGGREAYGFRKVC